MAGHREKAVTGVFIHCDDILRAIKDAKNKDWNFDIYSPFACDELLASVAPERSPVGILSLFGAITALVIGFALQVFCSLDWSIQASTKPFVSVTVFMPLALVFAILFGVCAAALTVLFLCRIPNIFRKSGYDPRFSDDRFGLVIGCSPSAVEDTVNALKASGAEEVIVSDAL